MLLPLLERRGLSRGAITLIGAAVSVVVIAVLAASVDPAGLDGAVRRAVENPGGLALAVASFLAAFALRASAWQRLLPGLGWTHSLAGIHLALGANHVLPFRLGEPFRVASVVRRAQVSADAATSTTLLLRSGDMLAVLALGFLAAPTSFLDLVGRWILPLAFLVAVIGAVGLVWFLRQRPDGLRLPGIAVLSMTTGAWLLESVLVWHSARWAGIELSATQAVLVTTVAVAAQIAAIAPGGLGTYEAASVAAYATLGVDPTTALTAAITAHALKTVYSLIAGGVAVVLPKPGFLTRSQPVSKPRRILREHA